MLHILVTAIVLKDSHSKDSEQFQRPFLSWTSIEPSQSVVEVNLFEFLEVLDQKLIEELPSLSAAHVKNSEAINEHG